MAASIINHLIYYSMNEVNIEIYTANYKKRVADLILNIQNEEFGIPITLNQQPDLNEISKFYQAGNGNSRKKAVRRAAVAPFFLGSVALISAAQLFDHSAGPSDVEGEATNGEVPQKKARVELEEQEPHAEQPPSLHVAYVEQSALMRQVVKDAVKETQRVLGEQLLTWADRQLQVLTREAKRFEPPGEPLFAALLQGCCVSHSGAALSDTMMEIAGLAQEKEELQEKLDRERLVTKELRDKLWREQNLRAAVDAANKDLKTRLLEIRGVIEANLESLIVFPEVLR